MRMWKRGGYRRGFLQRVGRYEPSVLECLRARPRIWVHAVSVGEIQIALRFMRALRERRSALAEYRAAEWILGSSPLLSGLIFRPIEVASGLGRMVEVVRAGAGGRGVCGA